MADGYSYVAFLDVLGYRALVQADRERGTLDFKNKLTKALSALDDINEDDVRTVAISDTIILSSSNPKGLPIVMDACVKLFISFLDMGLLLRGGIAYSQHFQSKAVTYSHALTIAYKLESEGAIWPRILVAGEAIEASVANGVGIAGTDSVTTWHDAHLVDVAAAGRWEKIFSCVKKMYKENRAGMREEVLAKYLLLENFLLSHPDRKKGARRFTSIPVKY